MKKRRSAPKSRRTNDSPSEKQASDYLHELSYEEEQASVFRGFLSEAIPKRNDQYWDKLATWNENRKGTPFSA